MSKKKVSEVADPITLNSDRKWREVKILVRTSMHLIELERVASGIEWTRGLFHVIKFIWSVLSSDCRFSWLYFVLDFFFDVWWIEIVEFLFSSLTLLLHKLTLSPVSAYSMVSSGNLDAVSTSSDFEQNLNFGLSLTASCPDGRLH